MECGAKGSVGKDKAGSQVLHFQAGKADKLDLSNLYPEARVVSDFWYRTYRSSMVQYRVVVLAWVLLTGYGALINSNLTILFPCKYNKV